MLNFETTSMERAALRRSRKQEKIQLNRQQVDTRKTPKSGSLTKQSK
jgi:uncharacterized membrane protein